MWQALLSPITGIISDVLDKVVPDAAERDRLKFEIEKSIIDQGNRKLEIAMSAILEEAKSNDKWTSRARPTFLYLMYFVISLCFIGGVIGIWFPEQVEQAAKNITALLAAIPEALWWLFGSGYLGYSVSRSFDKDHLKQLKGRL